MRGLRLLLLCCCVALASKFQLKLNPQMSYEYRYEGVVKFGLGIPNVAESGVRLTCKVNIAGLSAQTFALKISDLVFNKLNGVPGQTSFSASPKIAGRISAQLNNPIMFEYVSGHIGDIRASAAVSDTVLNIVRGILGFFQVTLKTTQRVYELEEVGIHGMCQSHYTIEENKETKDMSVTKVVDVDNCREKAAVYSGLATAVLDEAARRRGESIATTVRYIHTVRPTAEGGVVTKAQALERQFFTPFNVKGGTLKMQATKELVLLDVRGAERAVIFRAAESRGNMVFKFVDASVNIPVLMQNLKDPVPKAVELIKRLADANIYQIDSSTTEDTIKVYQLLRAMPFEGLEELWKNLSTNDEYRRWLLDMVVEVGDARLLKFLEKRFLAGDMTPLHAMQIMLLSMNHLRPLPELVELAKVFLNMPFTKSNIYLWHGVVLSYGSLVYKHCAYYTPCPVAAVQPLLDMATEALRTKNEADMVLVLKALGNAGHPGSIKTIIRFLPGVAAVPVDLPPRVLSAAVQSMRLIAARDPHSVQDVALTLFLEKNLPSDIRMLALMMLFEAKPSMSLVSTLATHLQQESDLHLVSFSFSLLKSLARSRTPENHALVTACNVAVKILAPKYGRLSYHYSKALRLDWFSDEYLMGTAAEAFMLKGATRVVPSEIIMKWKMNFIGRILQLLEIGVRADGIKELFGANIPAFKGDLSFTDFQAILSVLKNWENLPTDQPVFTAYSRASGQEWFFTDINKDLIQNIVGAISPDAGKERPLWTVIENLQKGTSWHWTRAFLIFEARFFQATTLGLPVEISKYYEAVNGITTNAKAAVNPPLTQNLGQLLTSEVALETDGFIGCTKDFWITYGINTELFQSGIEFKAKTQHAVPWKFSVKMNVREKKFEFDLPAFKKEVELFSVRSNVYVVSRNIEEPDKAKMTPIMPKDGDSDHEVVHVDPSVVKPESKPMVRANTWHPVTKMCTESNIYGVGACVESELRREFYHEEYPLYYFLGYTAFAFKLTPAQTNKPMERIHFELNLNPSSRQPMNAQQLLRALRRLSKEAAQRHRLSSNSASSGQSQQDSRVEFVDSAPAPVFNVKAFAVGGNEKPEGYEACVYYTPEANMKNTQLIVSQVGDDTNWKMCLDASVISHSGLQTHIRWGSECQSYEMSIKANAGRLPGSLPTLRAKVHWSTIPETMAAMGRRVESYIPGVALLLGFSEQHETNVKQEVTASVVAASADSVDVKLKLPEYTVYRKAIPFPLPPVSFEEVQSDARNGTRDGFGQT
uniref:Vitellogenin 3, phosvitinless n=1 Tax=Cynoglossus semilaevis TaxID=244447 RepID=A0A3P8VDW2_CYNSE